MISKSFSIVSVILFLSLFGCNRPKEESEDAPAVNVRVPVKISRLVQGNIESTVTAFGSTDALRKEKVVSPVVGRVILLKVLEGSLVKAGEVMIILRTREAQAAIEGAQALLRSATTERQKQEAKRALALADSLQPQITMRASFDGVVASRNVAVGELVGEQAELLTLIDPSMIVFIADVSINSISTIHPNLPARIRFPQFPIGQVNAVVEAISPQAETQSQSVKVRLHFRGLTSNQQRLMKTNVPGTAQIITDIHRNILLVQRSALLHDDESNLYSVVIMTQDSLAQIIPVTIGAQSDSIVEVHGNLLRAGQNVITRGQYALTDSTRVTVE